MFDAPRVDGFTDDEQALFVELFDQLKAKERRNKVRASYYDAKNALRLIGAGVPPVFRTMVTVLGWPAKSVDTLAARTRLLEFVGAGVDLDGLGVGEVWEQNRLASESKQAHTSTLIHAVSWLVTTKGQAGEPEALITARDALSGTGLWDPRRRRLSAFLSVIERDDDGRPTDLVIYTPEKIITAAKDSSGWTVERHGHKLGRVPVEPLVFKPRLGRPFGSSRLSRPVMAMTDLAMRTVLRSEVTAELYSVPQRVILGADESAFKNPDGSWKTDWQMAWAKVLGIPVNDDNQVPEFKQLAQATQEPHMAQLRALAQLFAGETSIPVSSLGISTEANPASAEAYYASREDLIGLAEDTTLDWSTAWQRALLTALEIREGREGDPHPDWFRIRPRWRNPAHVSQASAADAAVKMISVLPWVAGTDESLELFGVDPILRDRLLASKRRGDARATVEMLAAAARRVREG